MANGLPEIKAFTSRTATSIKVYAGDAARLRVPERPLDVPVFTMRAACKTLVAVSDRRKRLQRRPAVGARHNNRNRVLQDPHRKNKDQRLRPETRPRRTNTPTLIFLQFPVSRSKAETRRSPDRAARRDEGGLLNLDPIELHAGPGRVVRMDVHDGGGGDIRQDVGKGAQ